MPSLDDGAEGILTCEKRRAERRSENFLYLPEFFPKTPV
jgi:hypothetical protein